MALGVHGLYCAMGASRCYTSTKEKRYPLRAVPADCPKFLVSFVSGRGSGRDQLGRGNRHSYRVNWTTITAVGLGY
jgi:hypothetical protein